jgi:hypothetical protein
MRYRIPQDVQREDTIVGPVTFMQLAISLIGGGLTYVVYLAFASQGISVAIWGPVVAIMTGITLTIAFVKIFNMKFYVFFFYMLEYILKPKKRNWFKEKDQFFLSVFSKLPDVDSDNTVTAEPKKTNRKELEEISKKLDL